MADIRINALATTAASTASDDFLAVDGSSQGTRKLNAFSPTFGGNLTVSGTGTINGGFTAGTNAGDNFLIKGGIQTIKEYGGGNSFLDFGQFGVDTTTNAVLRTMSSGSRVTALTLSGANTTLAGNLTVSGGTITGGASGMSLAAGGTNQNITLTPSGTGKVLLKLGDVDSQVNVEKLSTSDIAFIAGNAAGSVARTLYFQGNSVQFGIGGVGEVGRFATTTGNLLLGTTTDSSNGKLQLATHTTSAGGIGFGTDNQLFRYNSVQIALTNSSGTSGSAIASNMQLRVENSGNGGIQVNVPDASTGGVYFGRAADAYYAGIERSGTNLQLRNNGTTALTLTNAQQVQVNATTASTSTTTGALVVSGGVGVAGAVNVGGAIAIGNTVQTAVAVASTHKVTISIGGSTYYLLATNV